MNLLRNLLFSFCLLLSTAYVQADQRTPALTEKKPTIDHIIFSYDRPLQLFSALESAYKYISGMNDIYVIYRASNKDFADAYEKVKKFFSQACFVKQPDLNPQATFKAMMLEIMYEISNSEYVFFGVDDIIVTDYVNLDKCVSAMREFDAYGFYLRLGKNIRQCYTLGVEKDFALPPLEEVSPGIFKWKCKEGLYDWGYPNSVDMTIFDKAKIKETVYRIDYNTPNSFDRTWDHHADRTVSCLCFEHSKMINVPLNIVQENKFDRNMSYFSTQDLLEEFNAGFKIDIDKTYKFENKAPHVHYVPSFTRNSALLNLLASEKIAQ